MKRVVLSTEATDKIFKGFMELSSSAGILFASLSFCNSVINQIQKTISQT
jgi:hypothetical protein